MKVGIMQPYFFPYLGYWQLINAVDKYVIYDDVNFIKGGYINRNKILNGNEIKYFNVTMRGASSFKHINEIEVDTRGVVVNKNLKILEQAYKKAPYFEEVFCLIKDIILFDEQNLAKYLENSIVQIARFLGMRTEIVISSSLEKNNDLCGQEKIIDICKMLGATQYYNAIGGKKLYDEMDFINNGIELSFLKMSKMHYNHYVGNVESNLSIIDVLMFNRCERVKEMLCNFNIIPELPKELQ